MENVSNLVVGVDVSKSTLDIYLHPVGEKLSVKNNVQGIKKLTKILSKYKESVVVCEASGGYENLLAKELYKDGYKIRIENPRKIRSLAYAKGVRAKTDSIDAKMIAEFGATISQDHEKQAMTLEQLELKELVKYKNNLKEAITQGKARLQNPTYCRTQKYIKKDIAFMEKIITRLNKEIAELLKKIDGAKEKKALMETMPGVGEETSVALIAGVPELGSMSGKQAASLVGVAPFTKESGTYKGVARIRDGRPAPRKALYMAALTAAHHNPTFKEFYEKLRAKGKAPKVAIVAVMRKMIETLNAMLRDNAPWNVQKISCCNIDF